MSVVRLPPPVVVAATASATEAAARSAHGGRANDAVTAAAAPPPAPAAPAAAPADVPAGAHTSLFRHEALRAYERGEALSAPLRIVPLTGLTILATLSVAVLIALTVASLGHVELTSQGRGVLRARAGVQPLIVQTDGVVQELLVREGDLVHAGQPLVRLDSTRLRASLQEAQSQLESLTERARRDALEATRSYERDRQLLEHRARLTGLRIRSQDDSVRQLVAQRHRYVGLADEGLVSQQTRRDSEQLLNQEQRGMFALQDERARIEQQLSLIEQTRRNGENDRAHQVQQAEARRDAARLLLEATDLRATRAGRIESLFVAVGEVLAAGTVVARLVPTDRPDVVLAFVPERDRAFVRANMDVRLEVDQLPVGEFGSGRARIVRVSSEIASQAEIERALGAAALPGVYFEVELALAHSDKTHRLTSRLGSGTLLTVRLPLRRRRVISLVFDPIRRFLE